MPRHAGGKGGSGHKHHVKKESTSRYKLRLRARGVERSPMTVYTHDKYPWTSRRAAA